MILSGPASKRHDAIYAQCIKAQETILQQIKHTEGELSKPLTTVSMSDAQKELKQVLRDMTKSDRHKAITEAIESGDDAIISAVLGSHPLATLVDPIQHQVWTRRINEKRNPEMLTRIDGLKKCLNIVASTAQLILPQFESAMRGTFAKAATVRGLSEASEKAIAALLAERTGA